MTWRNLTTPRRVAQRIDLEASLKKPVSDNLELPEDLGPVALSGAHREGERHPEGTRTSRRRPSRSERRRPLATRGLTARQHGVSAPGPPS